MVLENALDGIRFSELCGSVFKWACESRIGRQQKWRLELAKVGDDVTAARKEGPAGGRPVPFRSAVRARLLACAVSL